MGFFTDGTSSDGDSSRFLFFSAGFLSFSAEVGLILGFFIGSASFPSVMRFLFLGSFIGDVSSPEDAFSSAEVEPVLDFFTGGSYL